MSEPLIKVPDVQFERAKLMLDRARWAAAKMQKLDRAATRRIVDAVAAAGHAKAQALCRMGGARDRHGRRRAQAHQERGLLQGPGRALRQRGFRQPTDRPREEDRRAAPPGRRHLRADPRHQPGRHRLLQDAAGADDAQCHHPLPPPAGQGLLRDAARVLAEAAKAAGAPDGAIQVIDEPNIPLLEKLMADERVDLIVATGGPSVVKAAYRSGNPAFGVGPGNAPVLVDDTADLKLAAKRIVASKSFDNSILCTNESTVLAFTTIADRLLDAMKAEKAHICSAEETEKLRKLLFTEHGFNVGDDRQGRERDRRARPGFNASGAKILVTPVDLVQPEEKLVREKLCPVLAFARVQTIDQAISCGPLDDAEIRQGPFRRHPLEERGQHHGLRRRRARAARGGQCRLLAGRLGLRDQSRPLDDHRHGLCRRLLASATTSRRIICCTSRASPTTRMPPRASATSPGSIR